MHIDYHVFMTFQIVAIIEDPVLTGNAKAVDKFSRSIAAHKMVIKTFGEKAESFLFLCLRQLISDIMDRI